MNFRIAVLELKMKCLLFDLETYGMDFNADTGFIMVASYKWLGEKKVHTITRKNPSQWVKDFSNDKELCRQMAEIIAQADMVVGWNSRSFDWRFLQTRMTYHRLGVLPPVPHEDGLLTARRTLKMRRSLENVGKFFGLKTEKEKMDLHKVWFPAACGDPKALKQVIKRCESDVLLLEEAYNLLNSVYTPFCLCASYLVLAIHATTPGNLDMILLIIWSASSSEHLKTDASFLG